MSGIMHGGDFSDILSAFPDTPHPIVDLSTGINPWPYPVKVRNDAWHRLPQKEMETDCRNALAAYLGASESRILLTPGTQIAISLLPVLFNPARVAISVPTYGEHMQAWRARGHEVKEIAHRGMEDTDADILIVANPNNPDGASLQPHRLLRLAERQARRGGFLIVDEAFADVLPETSLAAKAGMEGLIVLRSFGKFFGLAGLRLGAVLAPDTLRTKLRSTLGPWAVSGPALQIGAVAYRDGDWIATTRERLRAGAEKLDALLAGKGITVMGGTTLYRLTSVRNAADTQRHLARAGIHVRRFDYETSWLRFGLPSDDNAYARLAQALETAA